MNNKWIKISLFFFLVIAFLGTLLRGVLFIPIPLNFQGVVHSHSHVAFQGWVYTAQFILLTKLFLNKEQLLKGRYTLQFKITIIFILGVLISFALYGYGIFSILCSTLFQIMNFIFVFRFLKDTKNYKKVVSIKFIKTGLWLGILSNLLPFIIGFLSAKGLKGTELFNAVLYSFLHLQYNGWFLFVGLGLLFKVLENKQKKFNYYDANKFYQFLTIAILPATLLSFLGMSFSNYILIPASIAVCLQCVGMFYLIKFFHVLKLGKNQLFNFFLILFLTFYVLKIIIQSLSIIPLFSSLAFENKFIILAYLHLNFIGVLSFLTLTVISNLKLIKYSLISKFGIAFLLLGFLITETLLATGGLGIFYSMEGLFLGSASIAVGIFLLILC